MRFVTTEEERSRKNLMIASKGLKTVKRTAAERAERVITSGGFSAAAITAGSEKAYAEERSVTGIGTVYAYAVTQGLFRASIHASDVRSAAFLSNTFMGNP